jgi:hypothetical protein
VNALFWAVLALAVAYALVLFAASLHAASQLAY